MRAASFNLPASEPSATEESQFNSVLLRERASADRSRRLDTPRWLRSLDTRANARVVQVGANDHRREHGDKVPSLIRQGWQATLYEPVPHLHARLRTRYAGNASVTLRQAAVCPSSCSGDDGARDEPNATVWAVDLASSPHEGSNLSDPRCAAVPGAEFVEEIGSLSRWMVLTRSGPFRFGPAKCAACSKLVGRTLPPNCMSRLATAHLRPHTVPCACLRRELEPTRPVALLVVDTEGYDAEVLRQYPFGAVPTWRVIFESVHLSKRARHAAAELLRAHGYINVQGLTDAVADATWHHNQSRETFLPPTRHHRGTQ